MRRAARFLILVTTVASVARTLPAQGVARDTSASAPARAPALAPRTRLPLAIALGVTVAGFAGLDRPARRALRDRTPGEHSGALDRVAQAADPFGTARVVVPSLVASWVVARTAGRRSFASAVLRIGAGYVMADMTESVLKGAVGRERPHVAGRPYYFDPFTSDGDEHSFPSAHVAHAMAVAAGVAREAHRPWVSAVAYLGASTVAWQRLHEDQHWLSDVGGASAIAIGAQQLVGRWHDRHARARREAVRPSIEVRPGMVVVQVR